MHDLHVRAEARKRVAHGESPQVVARELGLARSSVYRWCAQNSPTDRSRPARCWLCDSDTVPPAKAPTYAYLLGQYLGDGHLVTKARVPVLRIYACLDYPAIIDQIVTAIRSVRETRPGLVHPSASDRMVSIQSYWKHWPCLFPQHGPGRKHERKIELTGWQRFIVDEHPWHLIRGLIHSDGCRSTNRVIVRGKAYEYPRYFFSNESRDILAIMGDALDHVGVSWRFNRSNSISIARRGAVTLMDAHVGPKQ